jgi:hypothetical protein
MPLRVRLSEGAQAEILRYVHSWLDEMTLGPDGKVRAPSSLASDILQDVLASRIQYRELDTRAIRSFVFQALLKLKEQGLDHPSWSEFLAAVEAEAVNYVSRPKDIYRVLFVLLADPWSVRDVQVFEALAVCFRQANWPRLDAELELDALFREAGQLSQFGHSCASKDTLIHYTPFHQAERAFELVRAILNWVLVKGQRKFMSLQSPLSEVPPVPLFGVFQEDGTYVDHYYTPETQPTFRHTHRFTPEELEQAKGILATISALGDPGMQQLVADLFLKYVQALDTIDWRMAFLSLWQCLEGAAMPIRGRRSNTKNVVSRVMKLNDWDGLLLLRELLLHYGEGRSQLVHEGIFYKDGFHQVSRLKWVVEQTITSLLARGTLYRSPQALEQFYIHSSLGTSDLETRLKVIQSLLEPDSRA